MTTTSAVRVERPEPGIAVVTLDRPESLNSLDMAAFVQIPLALWELAADDEVSVVILTGAGKGFCAGADLAYMARCVQDPDTRMGDIMREAVQPALALAALPQVTIAAVNGPAAGAGWGLALGCDLRIAGPTAKFGATFVRMGLGPDYGVAQTLPRIIGRERAMELLATGRIIDASEALRLGAVLAIEDDPLGAALELARSIAAAPGRALRSLKSSVDHAADCDLAAVIGEVEFDAQVELFDHPDFLAGAATWLTKHGAVVR